jgi:hypothetical protein
MTILIFGPGVERESFFKRFYRLLPDPHQYHCGHPVGGERESGNDAHHGRAQGAGDPACSDSARSIFSFLRQEDRNGLFNL